MSIYVEFGPINMTLEQYEDVERRLPDPPGRELHIAAGKDGEMYITEIWDGEQQAEAHGEKLLPVLKEVGIEPVWADAHEVRNIIRR